MSGGVVRFGDIELDARSYSLRRSGRNLRLERIPMELLLFLVERHGLLVTREEIIERLWGKDVFLDTDNSINTAIRKIRRVLKDDPEHPRFVQTISGKGYRFVAPLIEESEPSSVGAALPALSRGMPVTPSISTKSPESGDLPASYPPAADLRETCELERPISGFVGLSAKRWKWLLGLAAAAIIGGSLIRVESRPLLTERDLVLITDFDNTTGDSVFDGTLKQALAVELGQSPFLNVVGQERVQETLRYMGRPPDTRVLLPLAREVCERLDAKALLTGSIARLGTQYVLALDAVNCLDGKSFARVQVTADGKEQALPMLGRTARSIRSKLGESLQSIQKFDVPVQQATTNSLEALKAYTVAEEQRSRGIEAEAVPTFKHAIEIDPNFAMAYGKLARLYANIGEADLAAQYLQRAVTLQDHVTERERLYLLSNYYYLTRGDVTKSIETAEQWRRTYPNDWEPYNWLSGRYQIIGRFEQAAAMAREALRLNSDNFSPYANLAASYRSMNRFVEAKAVCERAAAAGRDNSYIHDMLYEIAFLQGDTGAMLHEASHPPSAFEESYLLDEQGGAALASGKLRTARQFSRRAQDIARKAGFTEDAAFSLAWDALHEADIGNYRQARVIAQAVLRTARGIDARETAAEALALSGDAREAKDLVEELRRRFPQGTVIVNASLPTIFSSIELQRGNPERSIELLQQAIPYELGEFPSLAPIYIRGQAYLRARRGKEAAAEFQKLLDHPGIAVFSPRHPLARLGLARSYALMGDESHSRQMYEDFLALWREADADIPILRDAKREYTQLRQHVGQQRSANSGFGRLGVESGLLESAHVEKLQRQPATQQAQ